MIKQFFSFALILVIALSPVQVTMAADAEQNSHGENCQMPSHQSVDMSSSDYCAMDSDRCQQHPCCVGQFNPGSVQTLNSFLFSNRFVTQLKFIADNDAVLTHYSSLLKRPPKV